MCDFILETSVCRLNHLPGFKFVYITFQHEFISHPTRQSPFFLNIHLSVLLETLFLTFNWHLNPQRMQTMLGGEWRHACSYNQQPRGDAADQEISQRGLSSTRQYQGPQLAWARLVQGARVYCSPTGHFSTKEGAEVMVLLGFNLSKASAFIIHVMGILVS